MRIGIRSSALVALLAMAGMSTLPAFGNGAPHLPGVRFMLPMVLGLGSQTLTVPYGATPTLLPVFADGTATIVDGLGTVVAPLAVSGGAYPTGPLGTSQTFTLNVVNLAGDLASATVTVTVSPVALSAISPSTPTVTTGHAVAFSASVTGALDSGVIWSSTGGTWSGSTWTAPGPGTYTVTAIASADGTTAASTLVTVVAAPTVSLVASSTAPLYGAGDTTVTPTFTGSSAMVGTGQGGNDISASAASGSAIPVQAGGYTVATTYWVRALNAAGDFVDASVTITPQSVAIGSVSPATLNKSVNASGVTFTASVSNAANPGISWSVSAGTITAGQGTDTMTWTAPATGQTVTVTAVSQADAAKSATATVTVYDLPSIASFTSSPTTQKVGGSVYLHYSFTAPGGYGILGTSPWGTDIASGVTSGGSTLVSAGGDQTYYLTVTNGAGASASANVAVPLGFTITSLTADSLVVPWGGSTGLHWTTYLTPTALMLNEGSVVGQNSATAYPVNRQAFTLAGDDGISSDAKTVTVGAMGLDYVVGAGGNFADGSLSTSRFNFTALHSGICTDGAGNTYVADGGNKVVRKIAGGVVSTLAGAVGSTAGIVDGTGANASFSFPYSICYDSYTNCLIVGDGNSVRKVTLAGAVTTLAGSSTSGNADGLGAAASFNTVFAVCSDGAGNYYVADSGNKAIRKIDKNAQVSTVVVTALTSLSGICFDPTSSSLYVSESAKYNIYNVTLPGGSVTVYAGASSSGTSDGTGTSAKFAAPRDVCTDGAGNLFVADAAVIRKIAPGGSVTTLGTGLAKPFLGIAWASSGGMYLTATGGVVSATTGGAYSQFAGFPSVTAYGGNIGCYDPSTEALFAINNGVVQRLASNGTATTINGTSYVNNNNGTLTYTYTLGSMVADGVGNLFVAYKEYYYQNANMMMNATNYKVDKIGVNGTVKATSYQPGNSNAAKGLCWDAYSSSLYLLDGSTHGIFKSNGTGTFALYAGVSGASTYLDGPMATAQIKNPGPMVSDGQGHIYFVDNGGPSVRVLDLVSGQISTVAGSTSGVTGFQDGAGALFTNLQAISCDLNGNVYVVDGSRLVRKISSGGVVTSIAGGTSQSSCAPGLLTSGVMSAVASGYALPPVPSQLGIDGFGDLYFFCNAYIMKLTAPNGI